MHDKEKVFDLTKIKKYISKSNYEKMKFGDIFR